jgi:hypothetical protein
MKFETKLLIFVLLLIPATMALEVDIPKNSYRVPIGSTQEIPITITSETSGKIILTIEGEKTWTSLSSSSIDLVGKEKIVTLFISPDRNVVSNINYKLNITANILGTNMKNSKNVFIFVSKDEFVDIDRTSISGDFIPTGEVKAKVFVKNFKRTTVQNIDVNMTFIGPDGPIAKENTKIPIIDPSETKEAEITFSIPEGSPAVTYIIEIQLSSDEITLATEQTITVQEKAVLDQKVSPLFMLTGYGEKIEVTNKGNIAGDTTFVKELAGLENTFFSGEPTEKNSNMRTWVITGLAAGDTATIEYRVDYLPLILLIILIIALIWYILFRIRVLHIKKFIMQKKTIRQGAEFTVGVEVKNSTGKKITNIIVKDFIPPVFNVRESVGVKFKKKKHAYGTELLWKLNDLRSGEERIVSYKIVPVFGLNSTMSLPNAKATYTMDGKNHHKKGGSVVLGIVKRQRQA